MEFFESQLTCNLTPLPCLQFGVSFTYRTAVLVHRKGFERNVDKSGQAVLKSGVAVLVRWWCHDDVWLRGWVQWLTHLHSHLGFTWRSVGFFYFFIIGIDVDHHIMSKSKLSLYLLNVSALHKVQLHIWLDQQHNATTKFVVEQQYNLSNLFSCWLMT